MDVADASARKLIYFLTILLHPTLVRQGGISLPVYGFDARLPGAVRYRFVIESDFHFAIETIVEQLPIFIAGFYFLAADRNQVISHIDLHPILISRAAFVNVSDFVASRSFVRFKFEAEVAGRHPAGRAA